jgi:hypothetical protein
MDQVEETVLEEEVAPNEVTEETETEVEAEEAQAVDSEEEETTIEFEEVEYNGKQYQVPSELKDALLMQGDYTRKTQEVAEQRKAFEQQRQEFEQAVQAQQQNLQEYAQIAAIDGQLEQYKSVDWNKFTEDDPVQAQQEFFKYQQLKDMRQGMAEQVKQREYEALQKQQATLAKQLEQGKETLAKEIPGWSDDLRNDLASHGQTYGYSAEEMNQVIDPRAIKVLNDAYLYRKSLNKATAKPKPEVKPVKPIKGKSSGKKDPNKMSIDDWMRERNKEVARRDAP